MERPGRYIGFSGVVSPEQQEELSDALAKARGLGDMPRAAYGVKAVHKTQYLDISNKYGEEWYPVGEEAFASALDARVGDEQDLRVAQICFGEECVFDAGYRDEFTERICERGRAWLNSLQFDMLPWHKDERMLTFLEEVKEKSGHTIILQAHGESMKELEPQELVRRLGFYAGALDYILFDASHGKGQRLDITALEPFVDAVYKSPELSGVNVGIAGGLNGTVIREELSPWVDSYGFKYPSLSWDAEGQLHPEKEDGTRPINVSLASDYIDATVEAHELGRYN